jgi:hypothetical protein
MGEAEADGTGIGITDPDGNGIGDIGGVEGSGPGEY